MVNSCFSYVSLHPLSFVDDDFSFHSIACCFLLKELCRDLVTILQSDFANSSDVTCKFLMQNLLLDLSREEVALAKRYPSHTPVCIRGGWEFCRPEQAVGEFPRICYH